MFARLPAYLLLGLMLSHSAMGEDLRLVTGDDYAPFTGKVLPAGGMLTQIVEAALAHANIDSTLDWQPWKRGYLKTMRGEYDATFPYVQREEREQEYLFSTPLLVVDEYIYSRADDPIEILDEQGMQGRSICIPLGWQPTPLVQDLIDRGVLRRHSPIGIKECARLVLLGRDDFFIADRLIGETALQLSGARVGQIRRSDELVCISTLHLIVPRNHPRGATIIKQFNLGLAALQADGGYQRLIERYLHERDNETP